VQWLEVATSVIPNDASVMMRQGRCMPGGVMLARQVQCMMASQAAVLCHMMQLLTSVTSWHYKAGNMQATATASAGWTTSSAHCTAAVRHRLWHVELDVISWLGAHHVRGEMYERAFP
jgi:hypothetical protein